MRRRSLQLGADVHSCAPCATTYPYRMRRALCLLLLIAHTGGCRTSPLLNPPPVSFARLATDDVEAAIYQGCTKRKWMPTKIRNGQIQAILYQRSHVAVVDIDYDADSFRVTYVHSENLRYKNRHGEQRIHSSYNKWVKNLVADIEASLAERRSAAARNLQSNTVTARGHWREGGRG